MTPAAKLLKKLMEVYFTTQTVLITSTTIQIIVRVAAVTQTSFIYVDELTFVCAVVDVGGGRKLRICVCSCESCVELRHNVIRM